MIWRILLLCFGVITASTAVIFIKESQIPAILLASYRQLLAAILITPLFLRDLAKHRDTFHWKECRRSVIPGVILGIHFISWIIGARMTNAANASLIVNLAPIAMPFFLFFLAKENPNLMEIFGTIIAMVGVVLLMGADFELSADHFNGDLICLGSMLFFTWYLACGRRNKDIPSTWLYVVPLYYIGGLFCLVVGVFFDNPFQPYSGRELLLLLGLAVLPTILGHSIFNYSIKHLRGQTVSIINLGQFISAGAMAFVFLHEIPQWTFYVSSVLLIIGACMSIHAQAKAHANESKCPESEKA